MNMQINLRLFPESFAYSLHLHSPMASEGLLQDEVRHRDRHCVCLFKQERKTRGLGHSRYFKGQGKEKKLQNA